MEVTVAPGLDAKLWAPLCRFACTHGWCPTDVCSGSAKGKVVYIDPSLFNMPAPEVDCQPPCTFVFPPSQYPRPTVINFPPISTSIVLTLQSSITTVRTVVTPRPNPGTATSVEFWNMPIPSSQGPFSFSLTSSLKPAPLWITVDLITTVYSTELFFNPEATAAEGPQTTTSDTAVLPFEWSLPRTTILTSNGITQTFSEDQLTQYRSLTTPVATTFPWPYTSMDGSSKPVTSTTPILISLQRGGFYWSPIPIPTTIPFPAFPTLPAPPYPTAPCLKLFGIFTIDCPPDKGKPTTAFNTGPDKPTCTANCGTLCVRNCESTGKPESECITQTVTDIWVSCSHSSCTTTKASVVSGCDVIASTTTTDVPYCPTGLSVNPQIDDQGDFATHLPTTPPLGVATRGFINPSVMVESAIYPVSWTAGYWCIMTWPGTIGTVIVDNVATVHAMTVPIAGTPRTITVLPTVESGWGYSLTAPGYTQIPFSNQPVCSCDESGCTPDSWPCCASGTC
ncbi:Glycoside hydrolase family 71 protein [Rutstroemia sp. NJR-2017a BBW]|nr:Glycoside hydrolase family 71 protein [Rutstroemia sp. NJR-2017a BBW]